VHDQGRLHALEQRLDLRHVAQFDLLAGHAGRASRPRRGGASARIVVVVEIVAAGHPVAHGGQAHGHGAADEAGRAGDEDRGAYQS
jgi:hypothetical protein